MDIFTKAWSQATTGGKIMDEKLQRDLIRLVVIGCLLIVLGSFIRVFIFDDQQWFGAMLLCLTIGCLLPYE